METSTEAQQAAQIAVIEAEKIEKVAITEIATAEDFAIATEQLTGVKTQLKNLKEIRDKYILPMKKAVETLDQELFSPPKIKLEGMERTLKTAMVVYHNRIEAEAKKAEAKIEKKLETGKMDMATAINKTAKIEQAPTQAHSAGGGEVRFNIIRKVRLADFSKVPPWVFADQKVIDAMVSVARVRALKEGVSGFEVYEEKTPAAFSNR